MTYLRSWVRSPVARLLTIAAAILPLALAGAVAAPGASSASYQTLPMKGREGTAAGLATTVPGELLHDLAATAGAKRGEGMFPIASPAASAQAILANFKLAGRNPRIVRMKVTAYCPCAKCCGPNARGLTASGCSVSYNGGLFVAADTDRFPLGTHVSIPGYADGKPVEVIDRGGAIKGNHLDVFFPTHDQAKNWGCKWLTVVVSD